MDLLTIILILLTLNTIILITQKSDPKNYSNLRDLSSPLDRIERKIEALEKIQRQQGERLEKKLDTLLKEWGGESLKNSAIETQKTEYEVILEAVPVEQKIAAIREIRTITGMGLKDTKNLVESVPRVVKSKLSLPEAEMIAAQLNAVGATVRIS